MCETPADADQEVVRPTVYTRPGGGPSGTTGGVVVGSGHESGPSPQVTASARPGHDSTPETDGQQCLRGRSRRRCRPTDGSSVRVTGRTAHRTCDGVTERPAADTECRGPLSRKFSQGQGLFDHPLLTNRKEGRRGISGNKGEGPVTGETPGRQRVETVRLLDPDSFHHRTILGDSFWFPTRMSRQEEGTGGREVWRGL